MMNGMKRAFGLIILAAVLICAIVLGVRVVNLVGLTQVEAATTPTPVPDAPNVMQVTLDPEAAAAAPILRNGSQGEEVVNLQTRLKELGYYTGEVDGQFGQDTKSAVIAFQRQNGMDADGIVGEATSAALYADTAIPRPTAEPSSTQANAAQAVTQNAVATPASTPVLSSGSQGEEVSWLQNRLKELDYYTGEVDGQFGQGTKSAVVAFQRQNGLDADGIVGSGTYAALSSTNAVAKPTAAPTGSPTVVPDVIPPWVRADGLPLLVNRDNYMPDGYQHQELVNMSTYCDSSLVKIKYDGTQAERVAVDALITMLTEAHAQGLTVWQVSAAYRSEAYQQQLFDEQVQDYMDNNGLSYDQAVSAAGKTVMDPGSSEHHTGLAFDITVPGETFKYTEQSLWLAQNCWQYGFIIRYAADKEDITGILAEPWHIRYVGVEHSLPMQQQNLCLEEYIAKYGSD